LVPDRHDWHWKTKHKWNQWNHTEEPEQSLNPKEVESELSFTKPEGFLGKNFWKFWIGLFVIGGVIIVLQQQHKPIEPEKKPSLEANTIPMTNTTSEIKKITYEVETRFGKISITENETLPSILEPNGEESLSAINAHPSNEEKKKVYKISEKMDAILVVNNVFAEASDTVIFTDQSAHQGCVAKYKFLTIQQNGEFNNTPEFGTCSNVITKVWQKGANIFIQIPNSIGPDSPDTKEDLITYKFDGKNLESNEVKFIVEDE
jgi:hypothetical protein